MASACSGFSERIVTVRAGGQGHKPLTSPPIHRKRLAPRDQAVEPWGQGLVGPNHQAPSGNQRLDDAARGVELEVNVPVCECKIAAENQIERALRHRLAEPS